MAYLDLQVISLPIGRIGSPGTANTFVQNVLYLTKASLLLVTRPCSGTAQENQHQYHLVNRFLYKLYPHHHDIQNHSFIHTPAQETLPFFPSNIDTQMPFPV